jgi:hypothetical protein
MRQSQMKRHLERSAREFWAPEMGSQVSRTVSGGTREWQPADGRSRRAATVGSLALFSWRSIPAFRKLESLMPSKKKPTTPPLDPLGAIGVVLEEIKAQNRAAVEAVDARHEEMRREIQNFRGEVNANVSMLRTFAQAQNIDIRDLKTGLARVEHKVDALEANVGEIDVKVDKLESKVGEIDVKIDKLLPLEERVTALEKRSA